MANMDGKVTAGPWKASGSHVYSPGGKANVCSFGEPRPGNTRVGFTPLELGSKDFDEAYANQDFMLAAVNACFSVAQQTGSTPEAVAWEIEGMYRLIDTIANDPDSFDMETVARAIIRRLKALVLNSPPPAEPQDGEGLVAQTLKKIEAAKKSLQRLVDHAFRNEAEHRHWFNVPADHKRDDDLIVSDALTESASTIKRLQRERDREREGKEHNGIVAMHAMQKQLDAQAERDSLKQEVERLRKFVLIAKNHPDARIREGAYAALDDREA